MSLRGLFRLTFLLIAIGVLSAAVRQQSTQAPPVTSPKRPTRVAPAVPDLSAPYLEAAAAYREDNYQAGRQPLLPLSHGPGQDASVARLVLGLYAQQHDDLGEARRWLEQAASPQGPLEDWRLLALAETAGSQGQFGEVEEALSRLVGDFPNSPLHAVALQRAAEIYADNELWDRALAWIDRGRNASLPAERSCELERIAWEIGQALEDPELQDLAAKRLLIDHPQKAEELGVDDHFAGSSGAVEWSAVLTADENLQRARSLIADGNAESALANLEAIAEEERSFSWRLLYSEALTRNYQGAQALADLQHLDTNEPSLRIELYWQRALAARDASRVRSGRTNLRQSQRQQMRASAMDHLEQVAELASDPETRLKALRLLFSESSDEEDGSFDRAFAVLQRLKQVDSGDTTGTRYLWRLGWQAYTQQDYTVAIGYWSELLSMYPATSSARSGHYWTARAHAALGHESRSHEIYRQISSAGTNDFYGRHARARLRGSSSPNLAEPAHPTEPWPHDPLLDRARWLSDLGLDELALLELEGLRGTADQRSHCAVEAIVLARKGQRRESIQSLVCAFPPLGRPQQSVVPEDALRLYYPLDFRDIIEPRAREQNLSPFLVFAMVRQESAFDAQARSRAGARGLMQLMPATGRELAQRLGLDYSTARLNDPDFSVRLGTRYFRQVLEMFDGNQELALAGYNGGPYRIKKLWRQAGTDPELDHFVEGLSLEETKEYVKRILLFEHSYETLYAGSG